MAEEYTEKPTGKKWGEGRGAKILEALSPKAFMRSYAGSEGSTTETLPMMPSKPEGAVAREIRAKRKEGENMGDYRRRVSRMALDGEEGMTESIQKAEGKTFPADQPREPVKAEEPYTPPKGPGADEPGKGTPPDKVGKLEASIEKAAKENKWEPQTSDAVSEAASSLANEMEGIFVDALEVYKTSEEHDGGVPDRVYFTDEDGYEWESVREEDGWDHHPVQEEPVQEELAIAGASTMPVWAMEPSSPLDAMEED
jgi:hypothetical protein